MEVIKHCVKDLKPFARNPRTIDEDQKMKLNKGLQKYGDLGGIVVNIRTNELVGGNQRSSIFNPDDKIIYIDHFDKPDEQGTVAWGYILHDGKRYSYREVDWSQEDHLAASLLANRHAGTWDWDKVKEIAIDLKALEYDLNLTGFDQSALESLLKNTAETIIAEIDNKTFLREEDLQNNNAELVPISKLKTHPRNYRKHPEDQLQHLMKSIEEFGIYKNIVVANDYTILTGHALFEAATKMGIQMIPIKRMDLHPDDAKALKVLTNDNELGHFAIVDERLLSELLKEIKDKDPVGLMGTGFDERMLANLVMVSRPASEIATINEAAEWVGMPEFDSEQIPYKLVVAFESDEKRQEFLKMIGATVINNSQGKTSSIYWPEKPINDISSVKFVEKE